MPSLNFFRRPICCLTIRKLILGFIFLSNIMLGVGNCVAEDRVVRPSSFANVNINKASADEIAALLIGIGPKKAEAIVSFRDEFGPFQTLEDLLQVKGIGEATLEKNKRFISVN